MRASGCRGVTFPFAAYGTLAAWFMFMAAATSDSIPLSGRPSCPSALTQADGKVQDAFGIVSWSRIHPSRVLKGRVSVLPMIGSKVSVSRA